MLRIKIIVQKTLEWGIYAWIFLLPWQTRWIIKQGEIGGEPWEYGTLGLYGTDILLFILLIFRIILDGKKKEFHLFRKPSVNLWPFIVGLLAVSFLSVYWASDAGLALYGFIKLVEGVAIFWLISTSEFNLTKANLFFVSAAVLQSLISIPQFIFQKTISSKWLGMALQDPSVLGTSVVENASGRFLRAYGSLPHPNILAGFLVIGFILLIGLYFQTKKEWQHNLILAGGVLISAGLFFAFSRASGLALLTAILVLFGLIFSSKKPREWHFSLLKFLGIILLVFLALALIYPETIKTRFSLGYRLEQKSMVERVNYYQQAWDLIKDNWMSGVGINNYTQTIRDQIDRDLTGLKAQPVHNVFVLVLTELGIFGLVLFLALMGMILKTIWQAIRHHLEIKDWSQVHSVILISIFILFFFDHYFWTLSVGIMLFWFCLGLWQKTLEE